MIANPFNDYFVNIGTNLASTIPYTQTKFTQFLTGSYPNTFVFYPTDNNEITAIIKDINPNKSPGPDCLDPSVVKQTAEPLAPTLSYNFNISMEQAGYQTNLKLPKSFLFLKLMTTENFTSTVYRPTSIILPIFSKILERVVYVRLMKYLTKHNILSNNQFGFRKKILPPLWQF